MNKKNKLRSFIHSDSGATMPLVALLTPVLIMILAGVIYSSATPSMQNEIRDLGKMMCLTAIKTYSKSECKIPEDITQCNTDGREGKDAKALTAVRALAERHVEILGPVSIQYNTGDTLHSGILVTPMMYFPSKPPTDPNQQAPCGGDDGNYPCIRERPNNRIGTAMKVSGTLSTQKSPLLSFASNLFGIGDTVPVKLNIACNTVSREIVTMVDISPSVSNITHLSEALPGHLGTAEQQESHNAPPSIVRNDTIDAIGEDIARADINFRKLDDFEHIGPTKPIPKTYFSFQVARAGGSIPSNPLTPVTRVITTPPSNVLEDGYFIPVPSTLKDIWDEIPKQRGPGDPDDQRFHTHSDYTGGPENAVWTFGHNEISREGYIDKDMHPNPGVIPSTSALYRSTSSNPVYYWIDSHPEIQGPEPLLSILKALDEFTGKFLERKVEGDMLSAIFYSDQLGWPHVVNLSGDSGEYIKRVLRDGPDALLQGDEMIALQSRGEVALGNPETDYTDPANVPPGIKLGWMSTNDAYTDNLMAMIEAAHQFNTAGGEASAVRAVVDFTDGIVTCGRGLTPNDMKDYGAFPNCADSPDSSSCCNRPFEIDVANPGPSCCRSTYDIYKAANENIQNWLVEHFFKAGISYNGVQFGTAGGPHWGAIKNEDLSGNNCLTDEEAREQGIPLIAGMNINDDDRGRGLFNYRNEEPFFEAAKNMYEWTLITGGSYTPILPIHTSCSGVGGSPAPKPTCNQSSNNPGRILSDYRCRSTVQQMIDGLNKVLESTEGYALLSADVLEYSPN